MAKQRSYRRTIRIDGKVINSPRFDNFADAEDWYSKMKRRKDFAKQGLAPETRDSEVPTFQKFAAEWLADREANHGGNTWRGEERNLRNHVLPVLGEMPINRISAAHIKKLLQNITVTKVGKGGVESEAPASAATVRLIRALISSIFQAALDESPSPVAFNPVRNLKLKGPRKAKAKLPTRILEGDEACIAFLEAASKGVGFAPHAKKVNGRALAYAALMIMTGCRKQEAIALRWRYVNFKTGFVTFAWAWEQSDKEIKKRTKKGEDEERIVPMSEDLAEILTAWRASSPFPGPDDFVLCTPDGGHMTTSTLREMHDRIKRRAGADVPPHGLRHSFAVRFAIKNGNMRALQEILGHSTMATTEIYSKIAGTRLNAFRADMGLGFGADKSSPRHHSDTTKSTPDEKDKGKQ